MYDILHQISIQAPTREVYDAIATESGLKRWWTSDTEYEGRAGGNALFGFMNRAMVFHMKIEEMEPSTRVSWLCTGQAEEWKDTRIRFELEAENPETTRLRFFHTGWASNQGWYAECNTTWGRLMGVLKAYVEGGEPGPLFRNPS